MEYYRFFEYLIIIIIAASGGGGAMLTVPYIVLRLRDSRQARHDPQLGIKVALHFLLTVGILIGALGATIVLTEIIGTSEDLGETGMRFGAAFLIAGMILSGLYIWIILVRTNDRRWPSARRTFAGIRFIIEGLVFAAGVCGVLVMILSKDESMRSEGSPYIAMMIIWGIAWVVELVVLMRSLRQPETPGLDTRCVMCGYDLRGSGDAVACPECGTLIAIDQRELLRQPALPAPAPTHA